MSRVQSPWKGEKMSFKIITGDITKCETTAIVKCSEYILLGGGGWTGPSTGPGLSFWENAGCSADARLDRLKSQKGYKLKAEYIIHTPGPVWQDGVITNANFWNHVTGAVLSWH